MAPTSSPLAATPAVLSPRPRALLVGDSRSAQVFPAALRAEIARLVEGIGPGTTPDPLAIDPAALAASEVIFATWGLPPLDAGFLRRAPRLRAVFYAAGSVKGFVSPELWTRKVVVSSAAAANAIPVAEYCLATILLSLKRFWPLTRQVREAGGWAQSEIENLPLRGAYGSTVGLVSLGHIGQRTLELLKRHDLRIVAHCPSLTPALAASWGIEAVSLMELFQRSDVVSLHTPLLPETRHLVRGTHLRALRPHATFINTSRGGIVHEDEMIAALQDRPDLTAILDVTDPLPPVPGSPLFRLPNLVLSPHIAGSAGDEMARLGQAAVDECRRFLAGEPLHHAVTPAVLEYSA